MSRPGALAGLLVIALLAGAPLVVGTYYTGLLALILIFALFAMSLDLLYGYAGLPSLGHAAFWGTSAYLVGILNTKVFHGSGHFALEMISGVLACALLAAVLGLVVLRSREIYLLMILLASSMMLWGLAFKWRSFTGGDDGLPGIARPHLAGSGWLASDLGFYYFVLAVFVLAAALMVLVVRSSFGHTLLGIRENELRMRSLGYNVWAHKYLALIVSAAFAGLAGSLIAYRNGYVSPTELHLVTSAEALIMVILGGAGTLFGPAVGAALIILIKNVVSGYTEHWMVVLGLIYMLTGMFIPQGLFKLFKTSSHE